MMSTENNKEPFIEIEIIGKKSMQRSTTYGNMRVYIGWLMNGALRACLYFKKIILRADTKVYKQLSQNSRHIKKYDMLKG